MEQNADGAKRREQSFRRQVSRRSRWLKSRRWRASSSGNPSLNTRGFNVAVFKTLDGWVARFIDRSTGQTIWSRRPYATEEAAKLAAFDAIERYKDRCD
jgi:hypothetical protein